MKYITRIFRSMIKWVSGSAVYTAFDYLCGALTPAAITMISAGLFDSAALVLRGETSPNKLYLYAALYLLVYLINDFSNYFRSIALNTGLYEKGTAYFRIELYEKLARLPLIAYEDTEILNRKERAEKAVNNETLSAIFNHVMRFGRSALSVVSLGVVLASYSLWLLPLSLLSVAPYLLARLIRGKEFYYVKRHQAKKTRLQNYLWGLFTDRHTAKEMRVMGFDSYITDKWRDTRDGVNEELWTVEKKDAISLLWCDGFRIAGYGISVVAVLVLVLQGKVSIGVFGAAMTAFLSMQMGMQEFLERLGNFPEQLSYAGDYYSFLDLPIKADGSIKYSNLKESIELKDVSFKYPSSERYALKDINLTIKKGEKIAVLGENGSGKTTLSKVLLGLYTAECGAVTYDRVSVDAIDRDGLYQRVSAIAQDFVRYHLTLRENVAISDVLRMDDDDSIKKALNNGGVDYSYGLDDMMGREFDGRELSGGQWQKLAIARGLFKESEIILLDESTSALDPIIETEILATFIEAVRDKTALIISHRVGLCKLVDRIVVMKDGGIAETGTHYELIKRGGEYSRLYGAQEKWYR